jgi:hypothetical protein
MWGLYKIIIRRHERLPFVPPADYWKDTPMKRDQVFRHVPLAHLGAEGQLSEKVIVRAHDLQVQEPNITYIGTPILARF